VAVFHAPPMDTERVLIHRDFHPGNVLWRSGRVSGIVDWQDMSVGPASVDAAWCRLNLLAWLGRDVADRFLRTWEEISGRRFHPWAEVVLYVDVLGGRRVRPPRERLALESILAADLAELGR
jgi:aminoglycoside phosphotransferase (APT) family kinase protein